MQRTKTEIMLVNLKTLEHFTYETTVERPIVRDACRFTYRTHIDVMHVLTPERYLHLRAIVQRAKDDFEDFKLAPATWLPIREAFNNIHSWAIATFGEKALSMAAERIKKRKHT